MSAGAPAALLLVMGLLSFVFGVLFGCRQQAESPFQQKGGTWHYHDTPIAEADAATFRALSDHYAKDTHRVYYGETYRDGREYFTVKRSRVFVVEGADPTTFTLLDRAHARDRASVFFEGVRFSVKDVASFELLDYGFARDRITGYYHQTVVPGSDGSTFTALDLHYSKDRTHVFHSAFELGSGDRPSARRSVQVKGARSDSFVVLGDGYAKDAGQAYFQGKGLTDAAASFERLTSSYAKTATQVFYMGTPIRGADPATFAMLERPTDTADATDAKATYLLGRRTPATR